MPPLQIHLHREVIGNFYFYGFTGFRINSRIVKNSSFYLDPLGARQPAKQGFINDSQRHDVHTAEPHVPSPERDKVIEAVQAG